MTPPGQGSGAFPSFLDALRGPEPVHGVELRPPPSSLGPEESMEAWIDANHAMRRLLRERRFVLLTDDAVGSREEESLGHLTANLGSKSDLSGVIPFLTCKHPLDYCLLFARRAASYGFGAVTVTGGDSTGGLPRCLPRSRDLRERIRDAGSPLPLGAWVNPFRDPEEQLGFLEEEGDRSDYFLTQVVSHHDLGPVDRFLEGAERRGLKRPGLFGVFYYRSANPRTLRRLADFLPVPAERLTAEFDSGASADEICARTIRALRDRGIRKIYVSNLGFGDAALRLRRIEALL